MSTPSPQDCSRRLVELSCLAPSVHNTQPWLWKVADHDTIELRADRTRQLQVTDPRGRNLTISCGAALHHSIVVARALSLSPDVVLLPDSADPDLLARIRLSPGRPPADAVESLDLIGQRHTDRRRFTSWPIPDERLALLAQAAAQLGRLPRPHRRRQLTSPDRPVAGPRDALTGVGCAGRTRAAGVDHSNPQRRYPRVDCRSRTRAPSITAEPVRSGARPRPATVWSRAPTA